VIDLVFALPHLQLQQPSARYPLVMFQAATLLRHPSRG
jgi:hypothetical protein